MWIDIASIVFVCVTMNHLGLIGKIESIVEAKLPILNCPKCASFWLTLTYLVAVDEMVTKTLAVSFLASYSAIWFELLEGFIDTLYLKLYGKIYTTSYDTPASDPNGGHSASSVS